MSLTSRPPVPSAAHGVARPQGSAVPSGFTFAPTPVPTLTTAELLSRVRERWLLALAPVVIGVAAAVAYVVVAPPVYSAGASVVVQPMLADQFGNVNLTTVINMQTEQQLVKSSAVALVAGKKLGVGAETVRAALVVDSPQDTQVINIHYQAGSPERAAEGAQTVAESYLAYREGSTQADADRRLASIASQIDTVNARISVGGPQVGAYQESLRTLLADQRMLTSIKATSGGRVITQAQIPLGKAAPRPVPTVAMGLAGGLIAGLCLSVALPRRRRVVRTAGGPAQDDDLVPPHAGVPSSRAPHGETPRGDRGPEHLPGASPRPPGAGARPAGPGRPLPAARPGGHPAAPRPNGERPADAEGRPVGRPPEHGRPGRPDQARQSDAERRGLPGRGQPDRGRPDGQRPPQP